MSPLFKAVFGKDGRAVGSYYAKSDLIQEEIRFIKKFLCEISKQSEDVKMSKAAEVTNMAFVAGTLKSVTVRDDGSAFALVDVGDKSKYIPCSVFDDKEMAARLGQFREEDFIQIQGYIRAWSQKKDGAWKNSIDIRITHIKNKPPARETSSSKEGDNLPW